MNAKVSIARLSILSNTLLIVMKLIVGLVTGSVSIISEAIHSSMGVAPGQYTIMPPSDLGGKPVWFIFNNFRHYKSGKMNNKSGKANFDITVRNFCDSIRQCNPIYGIIILTLTLFFILPGETFCEVPATNDTIKYYDGQMFTIIGKYHSERNYVRFPKEYKNKLRGDVWDLGQHSAGISIRFCTNASLITVRWTVMGDNTMDHMASTGVKGIDLYAYVDDLWKYVNTGRVKGKINEFTLLKSDGGIFREYLLNLPLYDGVDSLSIGVNTKAKITPPKENWLTDNKPVVYYGSSITQGGCASRPGMAFTNILSRSMDRSFINMGFSGMVILIYRSEEPLLKQMPPYF